MAVLMAGMEVETAGSIATLPSWSIIDTSRLGVGNSQELRSIRLVALSRPFSFKLPLILLSPSALFQSLDEAPSSRRSFRRRRHC